MEEEKKSDASFQKVRENVWQILSNAVNGGHTGLYNSDIARYFTSDLLNDI